MRELWKTLRLAVYVCALPLVATAAFGANNWISTDGVAVTAPPQQQQEVTAEELRAEESRIMAVAASRSHVLYLDEEGAATGRLLIYNGDDEIRGAARIEVNFSRDQQIIRSVMTDSEGVFTVRGLEPDSYSLTAVGRDVLANFGVHLRRSGDRVPAPHEIQMDAFVVHGNTGFVRQLLDRAPSMAGVEVDYEPFDPRELDAQIETGQNVVQRRGDGRVTGRVAPLQWDANLPLDLRGNVAYLVRGDEVVAEQMTDVAGRFEFADVEPGFYDFVCTGPHGKAAFRFEVVATESVGWLNLLPQLWIAGMIQEQPATDLQVVMSDGTVVDTFSDEAGGLTVSIQTPPAPAGPMGGFGPPPMMGGGGFGGGGGGGLGGGFGMGGDLLRLAGLGLLAWAIVEIADSRDTRVIEVPVPTPPPPVTPAQ